MIKPNLKKKNRKVLKEGKTEFVKENPSRVGHNLY